MFHSNSQEQTIYRSLTARIQLGFYDGGDPFPTAQEVAAGYEVSFCPAQRALKALENDGLIKLCRGRRTMVLKKPYDNFLKSEVFQNRVAALIDLIRALNLFSSVICFQGLCRAESSLFPQMDATHPGKRLYQLFDYSIRALGSRTVRSLYSDIGAFAQSAFQDILYDMAGIDEANRYLTQLTRALHSSLQDCKSHRFDMAEKRLKDMESEFFEKLIQYLNHLSFVNGAIEAEYFLWAPRKGRTRYCDIIAIDLLRKINQGAFPVGALLPGGAQLSDTYHVSEITIRRTIALLNQLGVTKTKNGVGTCVVSLGNESVAHKIKDVMNDDNYIAFLEALQFLAITGKTVIPITFAHCPDNALYTIARAADIRQPHKAMVATIGACLQAIVHHCPFAAVREIYGKLTLSLLGGSVLQFDESGRRPAPNWAEISKAVGVSLKAKDGDRFAKAFCALAENCFYTMKRKLIEMGVEGAERVADPVGHFH